MAGDELCPGFGARIRQARVAAGYKRQRDAALAMGVTRQASVSAWETETTVPDAGAMRLLADHFANADDWFRWLRTGGEMPAPQRRGPYTARSQERASMVAQRAIVTEFEKRLQEEGRRQFSSEEVLGWFYRMLRAAEVTPPGPSPGPSAPEGG